MSRLTSTTLPSHIISLSINMDRINLLKKYGFTEQNNIVSYRDKVSKNKPAQTLHKVKALAEHARKLNLYVDRCVGLA
ncbi:MAG: hypothetical protein HRT53_20785 [Colwellia sp.]|nr:hypothetical protein [Colwellia sp.]